MFQRDASGNALVTIAGQWLTSPNLSELQWRIVQLNPQNGYTVGIVQNWSSVWDSDQLGLFKMVTSLSGGWYSVEIAHIVNGQAQQFASTKFGVGEVFVVAGQSNAQAFPEVTDPYNGPGGQPYEGVVADLHIEHPELQGCFNEYPAYPVMSKLTVGSPIAPQGRENWCYTVLGNKLVDQIFVPVAFFNAAKGNTHILNWSNSANNNPTSFDFVGGQVCNQVGQPYAGLRRTLNFYGSLFGTRGILWHQGENDTHLINNNQQTGPQYRDALRFVINKARENFAHNDLSWWVSKATHRGDSNPQQSLDIRNAQGTVQTDAYNKAGPNTDDYVTGYRSDGTHFSGAGLNTFGNLWYNNIVNVLTSAQPVLANQTPDVSVNYLGGNYYRISVTAGEQQYFWTAAGGSLNENNPTNHYVDVPAGSSYQCYVKTHQGSGNIIVSQTVYLPFSGGYRLSSTGQSSEEDYGFSLKLSPNPVANQTTLSFRLPRKASTELDIIDQNGKVVKTIVAGQHDAGFFEYTTDLTHTPSGVYFCRLKANDLSITKKFVKN